MKKDKKLSKKSKRINIFFIVLVIILIFMIFCVVNINTIKSLIVSNTTESEVKNLGVTDEAEAESWDNSIVSEIIVDTSMTDDEGDTITMYVPIPNGYTVSDVEGETTVKEGLVIYEGEETVSEDSDAKTTRNQFVWVPVNPSDVYWTDSDGSVYGIEYTFTSTGRTSSNSKTEPYIWSSSHFSYADMLLDYYKSDINSELEIQADMQKEFSEVTESIEKYGRILYRTL